MRIDVDVDATRLLQQLPNAERRIAYSVQAGLNRTIMRMRDAVVARVVQRFAVRERTKNWLIGSSGNGGVVGRTKLASVSQDRPYAELYIGDTSKGGPFLLPRFEDGGVKGPSTPGAKSLFTPITGTARGGGFRRSVDPALTFAGMKLRAYQGGKRLTRSTRGRKNLGVGLLGEFGRVQTPIQGVQWKGQNRTFLLQHSQRAPLGAVFQRFGRGRDDIREVWKGIAPWTIPSDLGWKSTAIAVAQRWAKDDVESAVTDALLRARTS